METVKMYNAGDRITERFSYTNPEEDHRVSNCVSYWVMDAPKQGFFEVPREMTTSMGTVLANLWKEVLERYGARGVVRLDRNMESVPETPEFANIANSEKMAKEKGEGLWKAYLRKLVEDFEHENETRAVRNMAKLKPQGFIVNAYKQLGLVIPSDEQFLKAGAQKSEVDELKEQVANLSRLVTQQSQTAQKGK